VTDRADLLPKTTLGNYEIRSKIGSGGMGDVFDALHTGLDKRVAIKTLRKRYLDDEVVVARFLREGQLASRIRHPNIVDVTDVGMIGGLPCLVMEFLEGESFSAMIRREGRLPIPQIVDLLLPVIAAVDFAHEQGVLHRDLKPSNIFLSRAWNGDIVPKVLDFGISKLVHDSAQAALTTDSAFVGTPHYASPELMRADKTADGRSDQYSMGVILYEASTGIRPFADLGNNFVALAMAICKGEYPPARARNPDLPVAFERLIQRAMAIEASERFPSMRALGEALLPFATERVRLIWAPTFQGSGADVGASSVVAAPSSTTVGMSTVPSTSPFSGTKPLSVPPVSTGPPTPFSYPSRPSQPHSSHPPVASPRALPVAAALPSVPPVGPGLGDAMNLHPSATPPGAAFDRLPSFGAGPSASVPHAKPRGSGAITALVGVGIGLAILVSVVVLRPGRRSVEPQTPATATASVDGTYVVELKVDPASAIIKVDGVVMGNGRLHRSFPRDGQKHELEVAADGYEPFRITFDETTQLSPKIGLAASTPAATRSAPVATAAQPSPKEVPAARHKPSSGASSSGKTKGSSEGRLKTDNIDPWKE
jgi:serine/threonine-protein kinase